LFVPSKVAASVLLLSFDGNCFLDGGFQTMGTSAKEGEEGGKGDDANVITISRTRES
jgi:hypothetical protein